MKFLLRAAFWLGVVIMLLPASPSADNTHAPRVSAGEALSAAGAALSDFRQFCGRQPDACTVGSETLRLFGEKARTGAAMLRTFLNEKLRGPAESQGGAPHSSPPGPGVNAARDTLLPSDLTPAWRGPAPRNPTSAGHPA